MGISRRNFLKGALAAGGVAAMGGMLSGCGKPATKDAESTQASQGRWSWSVAPDPIADDKISQTYDCEICIVGAGNAGNMAAIYAAAHGANTVVLQKTSSVCPNGQSTAYFKDWKNAAQDDSAATEKAGAAGTSSLGVSNDVPQQEWEISTVLQQITNLSTGITNIGLIRRHVLASNDAIKWLTTEVPEPAPKFTNSTTLTPNRVFWSTDSYDGDPNRHIQNQNTYGNYLFNENCAKKAQDYGATYLFSTPARQLVTDDAGAVTGVIGQTESGDYIKVNASKGVILCSGDISHDEEMLECYAPEAVGLVALGAGNSCTGDGTKMGLWIGAAVESAPSNVQYHLDYLEPEPFKGVPWLTVNIKGERFTNENMDYGDITNAYVLQPEHTVYQIIDSHLLEHISEYAHAFYPSKTQDAIDEALKAGTGFKADSIGELAKAIGVDQNTLEETVKRYNGYVDAGIDSEYGVDPEILKLNGIKDGPFYAFKYVSGLIIACAGLRSDECMHVLNEENDPIKGLYAAGNAQGSFFAEGYDHELGGWTLGRAKVGGILAVKSALGTLDDPIA